MADHIGVFQVPGVFVGHPLVICKDVTERAFLAVDCGLVAAELLHAHDICFV